MIITYSTWEGTYETCLFIPDTVPWKLTVEIDYVPDDTDTDPEACTLYSVKLITGTGMEETILTSEEFWGKLPEEVDEEKEIREFFNYVVQEAALDLAFFFEDKKRVFNLSETIDRCTEDWMLQLKVDIKEDK